MKMNCFHNRKNVGYKFIVLIVLVMLAIALYMTIGVRFNHPRLFAYAMEQRTTKVIVMLLVAFSIGAASLVFQSIIRRSILAILTQSNNIQMKLTVRELVNFGRFPYSGSRLTAEDEKMIDRAIDYMELTEIQDQYIDELSGGQRQRAYIAMVIAQVFL